MKYVQLRSPPATHWCSCVTRCLLEGTISYRSKHDDGACGGMLGGGDRGREGGRGGARGEGGDGEGGGEGGGEDGGEDGGGESFAQYLYRLLDPKFGVLPVHNRPRQKLPAPLRWAAKSYPGQEASAAQLLISVASE